MTDEKKELINNLLQNLGIYCSVDQISQDNIKEVFGFKRVSNALDLFCPQCNQDKTFVLDRVSGSDIDGDFVINHYVYCKYVLQYNDFSENLSRSYIPYTKPLIC